MQDSSKPFTRWLCDQIETFAGARPTDGGATGGADGGEALLNRAVRDAHAARDRREAAAPEAKKSKKSKGELRQDKQGEPADVTTRARRSSRNQEKASRAAAGAVSAAAAAAAADKPAATSRKHRTEERSRSRNRRRRTKVVEEADSARPAAGSAVNENSRDKSKVVLTPNVQFLRDAYHQKGDEAPAEADGPPSSPSKWHFRAEPLAINQAPPQASVPAARPLTPEGAPQYVSPYAPPPQRPPAPGEAIVMQPFEPSAAAPARPPLKTIAPKKWKVAHQGTVVRETEQLNSKEVRTLNEGEIVEQVAPALTLQGGIIRICIRHPSSPQFPSPIGWVTQDASKAGGPVFLVPGPEPMSRGKPWRPVNAPPTDSLSPAPFRGAPPTAPFSQPPPRGPPAPTAPRGPRGTFSNLVWTPGDS